MVISGSDVYDIPQDWAAQVAEEVDPDWFLHYGDPYVTIFAGLEEKAIRDRVEEIISFLNEEYSNSVR